MDTSAINFKMDNCAVITPIAAGNAKSITEAIEIDDSATVSSESKPIDLVDEKSAFDTSDSVAVSEKSIFTEPTGDTAANESKQQSIDLISESGMSGESSKLNDVQNRQETTPKFERDEVCAVSKIDDSGVVMAAEHKKKKNVKVDEFGAAIAETKKKKTAKVDDTGAVITQPRQKKTAKLNDSGAVITEPKQKKTAKTDEVLVANGEVDDSSVGTAEPKNKKAIKLDESGESKQKVVKVEETASSGSDPKQKIKPTNKSLLTMWTSVKRCDDQAVEVVEESLTYKRMEPISLENVETIEQITKSWSEAFGLIKSHHSSAIRKKLNSRKFYEQLPGGQKQMIEWNKLPLDSNPWTLAPGDEAGKPPIRMNEIDPMSTDTKSQEIQTGLLSDLKPIKRHRGCKFPRLVLMRLDKWPNDMPDRELIVVDKSDDVDFLHPDGDDRGLDYEIDTDDEWQELLHGEDLGEEDEDDSDLDGQAPDIEDTLFCIADGQMFGAEGETEMSSVDYFESAEYTVMRPVALGPCDLLPKLPNQTQFYSVEKFAKLKFSKSSENNGLCPGPYQVPKGSKASQNGSTQEVLDFVIEQCQMINMYDLCERLMHFEDSKIGRMETIVIEREKVIELNKQEELRQVENAEKRRKALERAKVVSILMV
eukprot:GHVL01021885.1.p1 GENE.GHVL01021885.1~~GHVL01021885.1.p1  ORF type:complete len:651 (-),score=146.20 GHVL01021885.1:2536-4488(-)